MNDHLKAQASIVPVDLTVIPKVEVVITIMIMKMIVEDLIILNDQDITQVGKVNLKDPTLSLFFYICSVC